MGDPCILCYCDGDLSDEEKRSFSEAIAWFRGSEEEHRLVIRKSECLSFSDVSDQLRKNDNLVAIVTESPIDFEDGPPDLCEELANRSVIKIETEGAGLIEFVPKCIEAVRMWKIDPNAGLSIEETSVLKLYLFSDTREMNEEAANLLSEEIGALLGFDYCEFEIGLIGTEGLENYDEVAEVAKKMKVAAIVIDPEADNLLVRELAFSLDGSTTKMFRSIRTPEGFVYEPFEIN